MLVLANCQTFCKKLVLPELILQRNVVRYASRQVVMFQIKINKAKKCKAHYSNTSLPHHRVNKITINFNLAPRTVHPSCEETKTAQMYPKKSQHLRHKILSSLCATQCYLIQFQLNIPS